MPCEFLVDNRPCRIPTKNALCHVHQRSSKLMKKVMDQKLELTTLNKRLSEAMRKLHIIDECDRVKYELLPISQHCSFRTSITNPDNKEIIESIFNAPFDKCLFIYNDLLDKRNVLTHRYTSRDWSKEKKRARHSRTLQELVVSIQRNQL
jgi:hypothetical protein